MDKKIIIVSGIVLVLAAVAGFSVYQYWAARPDPNVENVNGGINDSQEQGAQIQTGEVEINGGDNGGLTICADQCGDGICQKENLDCNGLACVCKEDQQECPSDCK